MAARTRRPKFYVYLIGDMESPEYIGKGSGRRLNVQERKMGPGCKLAMFWSENDAYSFEREKIAELSPAMNKHPGGNGSRAIPEGRCRQPRIPTPQEVAKRLLEITGSAFLLDYVSVSEIKRIESIAWGTECG